MKELMKRVLHEINKGLKKDTHPTADIKCFVTYVQDLPNGTGNCDYKTVPLFLKSSLVFDLLLSKSFNKQFRLSVCEKLIQIKELIFISYRKG